MTSYVIDASVAAKWYLPAAAEPLSGEAMRLLESYTEGRIRFLVPDLFWAEIGNLLWKASRKRRLSPANATKAWQAMCQRHFPTIPSHTLLEDAFAIANLFDRTVYDALYVALAVMSKSQLITADERLANALAAHLPVKWLGAVIRQ